MNDRDELARRMAEKLGLTLYQPHLCPAGVPIAVWDALLSAEQRVEQLQIDLAKLYAAIGPMDEFDDVGVVVEIIKELRARSGNAH